METCHHCEFAASGHDAVAYMVVAARKHRRWRLCRWGTPRCRSRCSRGPTLIAAGGVTPSTPERPAGPIGPGAPAAPVAPVAPCGPIGPAGPTEPSEPLQAEERRRERRVNVERKAGMRRV